jgi:hypothetical protein
LPSGALGVATCFDGVGDGDQVGIAGVALDSTTGGLRSRFNGPGRSNRLDRCELVYVGGYVLGATLNSPVLEGELGGKTWIVVGAGEPLSDRKSTLDARVIGMALPFVPEAGTGGSSTAAGPGLGSAGAGRGTLNATRTMAPARAARTGGRANR